MSFWFACFRGVLVFKLCCWAFAAFRDLCVLGVGWVVCLSGVWFRDFGFCFLGSLGVCLGWASVLTEFRLWVWFVVCLGFYCGSVVCLLGVFVLFGLR